MNEPFACFQSSVASFRRLPATGQRRGEAASTATAAATALTQDNDHEIAEANEAGRCVGVVAEARGPRLGVHGDNMAIRVRGPRRRDGVRLGHGGRVVGGSALGGRRGAHRGLDTGRGRRHGWSTGGRGVVEGEAGERAGKAERGGQRGQLTQEGWGVGIARPRCALQDRWHGRRAAYVSLQPGLVASSRPADDDGNCDVDAEDHDTRATHGRRGCSTLPQWQRGPRSRKAK